MCGPPQIIKISLGLYPGMICGVKTSQRLLLAIYRPALAYLGAPLYVPLLYCCCCRLVSGSLMGGGCTGWSMGGDCTLLHYVDESFRAVCCGPYKNFPTLTSRPIHPHKFQSENARRAYCSSALFFSAVPASAGISELPPLVLVYYY